ncbi:MAG: T9SS type A sorting domain-containing protein, partial [Bacteroidales bacterium]|nr:T9SS type A sorting domain-containing protein [Bacteroidales bacterium]
IGKQILVNQNVDEIFEANFQVYPNPVKDALSVVLKEGEIIEITVFDGIGRKILSRKGEERIDVSSLKSGLYLLFVTTESGTLRTRFVKE